MIYLVRNDIGSRIEATITEATGTARDLEFTTCYLHVRKVGTSTSLYSIIGEITDQTNGVVVFTFDGDKLDLEQSRYQAEIELVGNGGNRETVYDLIDITVRDEIA